MCSSWRDFEAACSHLPLPTVKLLCGELMAAAPQLRRRLVRSMVHDGGDDIDSVLIGDCTAGSLQRGTGTNVGASASRHSASALRLQAAVSSMLGTEAVCKIAE